ncbi:MAG: carbohydrate ABC transporter permease [Clostridiales bacterium]|nr:carbohydrate ABC transporter permease [Clostridiales bacterium]
MKEINGVKIQSKFKRALIKWKEKSLGVKIFLITFFLFFLIEAIIQLIPFVLLLNDSLKSFSEYSEYGSLKLTTGFVWENYSRVFSEFVVNGDVAYFGLLFNTLWQAILFVIVNLASSLMVSYSLAKFNFPGKGLLYGIMIFIQVIPIVGVGAAAYKLRYALGMINNPGLLWVCWAVGFDYSAFVMYGTFRGVSDSYAESAEIDGANELTIFFKIMFPQILPLALALSVDNFIARWNDYTTAQIDLPNFPTLSYGMFLFSSNMTTEKTVYFASLVMAAIPGILLYAFFQNFIIKNVSVGGIKG